MFPSDPTVHAPETWAPVRRAAEAVAAPIRRILRIEAASGLVLLAAAAAALVWANLSPDSYEGLWHMPIGAHVGPYAYEQSLHFWINEGLMTLFFYVVGLEIRREVYEGSLSTLRQATLPLVAAVGGMVIPPAIFIAFNAGRTGASGWAIPMATDIAFAVGVLALLGSRVPAAARVLLLALAVIDDIGAILVIAFVYSTSMSLAGLPFIGVGVLLLLAMRMAGNRTPLLYLIPGALVWVGFLETGVHPTIAGVALGLMTPVRPWFGPSGFAATTHEHLEQVTGGDHDRLLTGLSAIEQARREAISPAERLIHALHPWVAFVIMPVFALANAGVVLQGAKLSGDSLWLFIGIVAGLALGKPIGIAAASWLSIKMRVADAPTESPRGSIMLVGMVGGIGFTMALFIAALAVPAGPMLQTAKLAILVGSATAIVISLVSGAGFVLHRRRSRSEQESSSSPDTPASMA
jgi:NhaA family Na+:H+ antiporter